MIADVWNIPVCRIRLRRKGQRGEEHDSRAGKRKKWITDKDSGDGLHGEPRQRSRGGQVEDRDTEETQMGGGEKKGAGKVVD